MGNVAPLRITIAAVVLMVAVGGTAGAQSLEEQTRRPPGTNSLDDGSMDGGAAPDSD
jgi:hypothetical protein